MAYVDDLIDLGGDAMTNLFDVLIEPPQGISEIASQALRLRVKGFDPPKLTLKTYPVSYKTVQVEKPAAQLTGERSFTLAFRVDSNYDVYKTLHEWRNYYANDSTGFATHKTPSNFTGTITVDALAIQGSSTVNPGGVNEGDIGALRLRWVFNNVWITDITTPKYTTGDANAVEVTATFKFGSFTNPAE